ncbi:transposase, partial [candidate division KSB1 bacterium]|nr:transposase [candidate division KSB1 bacterium]
KNKVRATAMNENTKQLHLFKAISGKEVHVDFDGGELSSDSGVLMLREVIEQLGLVQKVADLLPSSFPAPSSFRTFPSVLEIIDRQSIDI